MQTSNAISRSAAAALTDGGAAKDRHALPSPTTRRFDAVLHVIEVVLREMRAPEPATRVALARLTEVLARILDLAPQPQENLRDFTRRLAAHMDTLPASARALIEKQMNQQSLLSALKVLIETLKPGLTFDLSIDMPNLQDRVSLGPSVPDGLAQDDDRSTYRHPTIQVPLPTRMAFPQAPGVSPGAPHLQQALGQAFSPEAGSPVKAPAASQIWEGDEPLPAFREAAAFLASDGRALAQAVSLARRLSAEPRAVTAPLPEPLPAGAIAAASEPASPGDKRSLPATDLHADRASASQQRPGAGTAQPMREPTISDAMSQMAARRDPAGTVWGHELSTRAVNAGFTEPETRTVSPHDAQPNLPSAASTRAEAEVRPGPPAPSQAAVHTVGNARLSPLASAIASSLASSVSGPLASLVPDPSSGAVEARMTGAAADVQQLPEDNAPGADMRSARPNQGAAAATLASSLRRSHEEWVADGQARSAQTDARRLETSVTPPFAPRVPADLQEAVKTLAQFDEWETLFYMLSGSVGDSSEEHRSVLEAEGKQTREGKPTAAGTAPASQAETTADPLGPGEDGKTDRSTAQSAQTDDSARPSPGGRGAEPGKIREPLGFAFIPYQPVDRPADRTVEDEDEARRRENDAAGSDEERQEGGRDAPRKKAKDGTTQGAEDGLQSQLEDPGAERHDAYGLYQRLSDFS